MGDDENTKQHEQPTDIFDKLGLSVQYGEVQIGETYPIYGMITEFVSEIPGNVVVVVNHNIELSMSIEDADKLQILKTRAFDPGIFVSTIDQTEPSIKGTCSTVVFGKSHTGDVH